MFPITLVIAPAGFGKTTAIKCLLAESDQASIYVATPPATSFEYFIQAFARACSAHFPQMATPPHHADAGSEEANLDVYIAWAAIHLRTSSSTIAIDDLQYSDQDRSIGFFLSRLADSTSGHVTWIFGSRTRGSLPVTRWQAYGDADVAITADDLRMTLEEAVAYGASLKCPATIEQLETWVSQTRGFPVPLAYAIRLAARRHSVKNMQRAGLVSSLFNFLLSTYGRHCLRMNAP